MPPTLCRHCLRTHRRPPASLLPAVAVFVGLLAASQAESAAEPTTATARKTRRILYNLDGDSCMWTKKGAQAPAQVIPDDLKTVVEEIGGSGSQVDTLLVCINAQCMYYPSKIGDMRGTLATPADRAKWPAFEQQRFRNVEAMFQQGVDPYALLLAEARRRGIEALLTYRMNDIHGDEFLNHRFWLEHPEYRLPDPPKRGFRAGLDFAHDAVRDYTFRLIEEAVQRYDSDGIELDFNRAPPFFQSGTETERITKINDLVRRVRQMLDAEGPKRNRRLVSAARVLPRYSDCRTIGLDPVAWAKEGWIDFLTVCPYTKTDYTLPIKPWKTLITNIFIYGGADSPRGAENYRRAARHFWQDGADGVYLFNFFTPREDFVEPPFEVLKELGDPP
jgi:hypothetical protein